MRSNCKTWGDHIEELRHRIWLCLGATLVCLPLMWPFSQPLIGWIWHIGRPTEGSMMVYTQPMELFFLRLKLSLILCIGILSPLLIWHIIAYISPALYRHERRIVCLLCGFSLLLFAGGALLALFCIFPALMKFSYDLQMEAVAPMLTVSSCIGLALMLMLGFGVCFQLPVVLLLLVALGILSPRILRNMRPYIIVGIFIIAGLLTPPDVVSQLMMAIPTWLLFEISIIIAYHVNPLIATN